MWVDEVRLLRRDRDVGLGDEVEREAGDDAVHRRDDRLVDELAARRRQLADALDHRELAPAVGLHEPAARERLDIGAAREGLPRAGDDRDPDLRIRLDALPAGA